MYKHGLPGIGVTGRTGKKGKSGNGVYFGTFDSFFTYIGNNTLTDISIDYDDINYDITYVEDELRLNPIYNEGDILYIIDSANNNTIKYMVEITEGMTTCTKSYFLKHIKYNYPFTRKISDGNYSYPTQLNIVSDNNKDINNNLITANKKHNSALVTVTSIRDNNSNISPEKIDNVSDNLLDLKYQDIPSIENSEARRLKIINNGELINKYEYSDDDHVNEQVLMELVASGTKTHTLAVHSTENKNIVFDTGDINKLFISNLHIKNNNYGNVEAYNTLYNPSVLLDEEGNCYTLTEDDYDVSSQSLNINISSFLQDDTESLDDYHFGYIHMYWNYNDVSYYPTTNTSYYQPNYIRGTETDTEETVVISVKKDSSGNYERNWNDKKYINISNKYIKQLLINTWDIYTLWDVSNQLDKSVSLEDIIDVSNVRGIIVTENTSQYLSYDYITTLDGKYTYKQYHSVYKDDELIDASAIGDSINIRNYITSGLDLVNSGQLTQFETGNWNLNNKLDAGNAKQWFGVSRNNISYSSNNSRIGTVAKFDYYVTNSNGDKVIKTTKQYDSITDSSIQRLLTTIADTETLEDNYNEQDALEEGIDSVTFRKYKSYNGVLLTGNTTIKSQSVYQTGTDNKDLFTTTTNYELKKLDISLLYQYIDTSFYSGIDYVTDPSILNIKLTDNDLNAMPYRHHKVIQWLRTPNGIKYYSKPTDIHYNWQDNTYDINTVWNPKVIEKPGFIDSSTIGESSLFNVIFDNNYMYITINEDGDQVKVNGIEIYEDSNLCSGNGKNSNNQYVINITTDNTDIQEYITSDENILNELYEGINTSKEPTTMLYTIKYSINDETEKTHTATFTRNIGGYTELRTLPKVYLTMYNDMESLEKLNKSENGILCNQFQTFVKIQFDDFSEYDWGKLSQYIENPVLRIKFGINTNYDDINCYLANTENKYIISSFVARLNMDIFNSAISDIMDINNNWNNHKDGEYYTFTINEIKNNDFYYYLMFESRNPEPMNMQIQVYVEELNIQSKSFKNGSISLNLLGGCYNGLSGDTQIESKLGEYTKLYSSEKLKIAFAPISYIAGYNQYYEKINSIISKSWYGNDESVEVALLPYRLTDIEKQYNTFVDRDSDAMSVNWNSIKFKTRYFQDNIQTIKVSTQNINYIRELLFDTEYLDYYLTDDKDDIYNNYLELVYNSELLNPYLMDDEYQFVYNNETYLASQYGQFDNNTAVFIKQENEYQVRSLDLLNSMKIWNDLYENNYHYEADNPYTGHLETYGNGYQYLPNTADTGQYLTDSIMTLEDIKNINNKYIFGDVDKLYFLDDICNADKVDEYTPSILFRSLLYQMKWVYPYYYTDSDNMLLIKEIPFGNARLIEGEEPSELLNKDTIPYNLCYNIYPRCIYNDEEQYNVILMLRRPSIVEENNYELNNKLCCLPTDEIKSLSNPINVMN